MKKKNTKMNEEETIESIEENLPEAVEQMVEKIIEEVVDDYKEELRKVKETMSLFVSEMESMKAEMGKMKNKYEAFSKQPAAEPVRSIFTKDSEDIADRRMNFIQNYKKDLFVI